MSWHTLSRRILPDRRHHCATRRELNDVQQGFPVLHNVTIDRSQNRMESAWHSSTATEKPVNSRVIPAVSLSIFSVVLVVVIIASCFAPMKDDIAWLLYVARRWLGGRILYQDLVEVNPPLIIWLSAIPSLLARWISVPPKFIAIPLFSAYSYLPCWQLSHN